MPGPTGAGHDLRASDVDRERVATFLQRAAADGRLDLDEVTDRIERVFAARTYGDLALLTADLPDTTPPELTGSPRAAMAHATTTQSELSVIFDQTCVDGAWSAPTRMDIRVIFGGLRLDFTRASVPHRLRIVLAVVVGEVELIVPDDLAVRFDSVVGVLATRRDQTSATSGAGAPTIEVHGRLVLGELTVRPPRSRVVPWRL